MTVYHSRIDALVLFLAITAMASGVAPLLGQEPAPLRVGITGSISEMVPDSLHPVRQLARPAVRSLVLELAGGALPPGAVQDRLAGSGLEVAALRASGILREQDGTYALGFGLFTREDVQRLSEVGERYGAVLAASLLEHRDRLDQPIAGMTAPGVSEEQTRYIVVGCFMLNWLAGPIGRELGLATAARPHGNGGEYALWAMDRPRASLEGLYWGSHNDYRDGYVLTSFGDHAALPRQAFPDLLRRMRGAVLRVGPAPAADDGLAGLAAGLAAARIDGIGDDAGAIMLALRNGPLGPTELLATTGIDPHRLHETLELLVALEYVRSWSQTTHAAAVPVLGPGDLEALREVRAVVGPVMTEFMRQHLEALRDDLSGTAPLRNGVPFEEIFTHVWHEVFARANRTLVKEGWFADPEDRTFPGFIPAVWHPSLSEAVR